MTSYYLSYRDFDSVEVIWEPNCIHSCRDVITIEHMACFAFVWRVVPFMLEHGRILWWFSLKNMSILQLFQHTKLCPFQNLGHEFTLKISQISASTFLYNIYNLIEKRRAYSPKKWSSSSIMNRIEGQFNYLCCCSRKIQTEELSETAEICKGVQWGTVTCVSTIWLFIFLAEEYYWSLRLYFQRNFAPSISFPEPVRFRSAVTERIDFLGLTKRIAASRWETVCFVQGNSVLLQSLLTFTFCRISIQLIDS